MTGITCALAGSGGSEYIGEATVTVGFLSTAPFSSYGFGAGGQGSIAPTTWASSGLNVAELKDVYSSGSPIYLFFSVSGSAPNSGWETLTVDGITIDRVDGSYANNGSVTSWTFDGAPTVFGTTVGDTRTVEWA